MRAAAIEAMTAELTRVGNPSSLHTSGRQARRVVEESRELMAGCLGAQPAEVIFTSGATEADNLVIKGTFRNRPAARRMITSAVEHHAVLESVQALAAAEAADVELIGVDRDGLLDQDQLRTALARDPAEVACLSVMWVNNETGVVQPVDAVTEAAEANGVPVHSDAVQAIGHLPVDFAASGLDALSLSAHKFGGPVGVGALLARKDLALAPIQHGGGQEREVRSGTLDVAGIAGAAAALKVAVDALDAESSRLAALKERLITGALSIAGTELNGSRERSAPHIVNLGFDGCIADNLLMLLDQAGIDCSTGSACTAGVSQPSHVLEAMGRSRREAGAALRFSLGHSTTEADVDQVLQVLPDAVRRARQAG